MNTYNVEWKYCLPLWINCTFPNSLKSGVKKIRAKTIQEAEIKFRQLGFNDASNNHNGYYRIERVY